MKFDNIQDILPFVRKPSSYLGNEINSIKKDPSQVDLFVALCFPDLYEIGMSHFGIQILYHILNRNKQIAAERVFSPGPDMEKHLRESGLPAFSLETRRPLEQFDIIGFSLLYELNYTNILTLLDLSGIPFRSAARDDSHPVVVAGGPCTFNPEPVADFFDAMVIGDGEEVIQQMCLAWLDMRKNGGKPEKEELLDRWACIKGVYIPSRFNATYDAGGFQRLIPADEKNRKVSKAVVSCLKGSDFPDSPVVPYGKPVHDRLRLEVARGCTRGCRFCQAGMIYRPVRERCVDDLLLLSQQALASTGYGDVSFLSLSTGDYSGINLLLESFIRDYKDRNIAVSLPSFRAGTLGSREMGFIKEIRKTGFTIAPEAGSQRLRDVINKNISEDEIVSTVSSAFSLGWNLVKLYFMIGLPTETDDDIEQIVSLSRRLSKIKRAGGRGKKINVSVTTFIPKAHTPFQWESQITPEDATEKIFTLRNRIESGRIGFKWQSPEVSLIEGLMARGDRRMSRVIEAAYRRGCRFDGWSDSFNFKAWIEAALECSVDVGFYTTRKRDFSEPLPWDHVDSGLTKTYLESERLRAYEGRITQDCRYGCNECGVCDFKSVSPVLLSNIKSAQQEKSVTPWNLKKKAGKAPAVTVELIYSKTGNARFFGHLEFVNIFTRAVRRSGIPVLFSEGFHPKPKISFSDPLPVGMESEAEKLWMRVSGGIDLASIKSALNRNLPDGVRVHGCRIVSKKGMAADPEKPVTYQVFLDRAEFSGQLAHDRMKQLSSDERTRDISESVVAIKVVDPHTVLIEKRNIPGKKVSVEDVLSAVFGVGRDLAGFARVVKKASLS